MQLMGQSYPPDRVEQKRVKKGGIMEKQLL